MISYYIDSAVLEKTRGTELHSSSLFFFNSIETHFLKFKKKGSVDIIFQETPSVKAMRGVWFNVFFN